jgi:hypothetical protein
MSNASPEEDNNEFFPLSRIGPDRMEVADSRGLHRPTHLHMLSRVPRYRPNAARIELSAIIVPTSRSAENVGAGLGLAARIAEAKDAQLIVVRSGNASGSPYPRHLLPATNIPTAIVDLPSSATNSLRTSWPIGSHSISALNRFGDISFKRNMPLLMGQMCGWSSILMLDDDMTTKRVSRIARSGESAHPFLRLDDVLADLVEHPHMIAAGYLERDFDDNSVVCHARRLAGYPQEGFIGGGALVIRCGSDLPFFPETYNEDWLFFFGAMLQARHTHPSSAIKFVGTVHQKAYYPFLASRAESEELGDVLAEGLFALLDDSPEDILANASSAEYWQEIIWYRQNMIIDLIREVRSRSDHRDEGTFADVERSLRAALAVYHGARNDWASLLAEYFRLFMSDITDWQNLLKAMTPASREDTLDIAEAFDVLDLAGNVSWLDNTVSDAIALFPRR